MTLGALIGGPVGFLALPSTHILLQIVSGTKLLLGNAFSHIPEIPLPRPPCSKSSRLRARHQSKLAVWALASSSRAILNRLYAGNNCHGTRRRTGSEVSSDVSAAYIQLQRHRPIEAALLHRARQEFSLRGAAALKLLR